MIFKFAAMDSMVNKIVDTVIKSHLPKGIDPSPGDELEDLLPDDGDLEALIMTVEENFDVHLPTDTVFRLFAHGTVADLKKAIVDKLVMSKTADHRYYLQNRTQILQRNRQYRARNLHQIRRKARIYRKKVKRRQIRPRRRVGTRGGGYMFLAR
jgi:hypothetical protein